MVHFCESPKCWNVRKWCYFRLDLRHLASNQFEVGAEGAEKFLGIWSMLSLICFIKSMILRLKYFLKIALVVRFPWNLCFWGLKWGKIFYKSPQNPSKTQMSLISENQLINFDLANSYFYCAAGAIWGECQRPRKPEVPISRDVKGIWELDSGPSFEGFCERLQHLKCLETGSSRPRDRLKSVCLMVSVFLTIAFWVGPRRF